MSPPSCPPPLPLEADPTPEFVGVQAAKHMNPFFQGLLAAQGRHAQANTWTQVSRNHLRR